MHLPEVKKDARLKVWVSQTEKVCDGVPGPCLDSQEDNKFYSVDTLTLEADLRDSDPTL